MLELRNLTLRDVAKLTGRLHLVMDNVEQAHRTIKTVGFIEYLTLLGGHTKD